MPFTNKICICLIVYSTLIATLKVKSDNEYETNIKFHVWNGQGSSMISDWQNNQTLKDFCGPERTYAILVHGWRDSLSSPWVDGAVSGFLAARGPCVFFMDYSYYSFQCINDLVAQFNSFVSVLVRKLRQLEELQFNPDNGFLFGFSLGAVICFEAGFQFGPQRLNRVDACDPMGPYFDYTTPPVQHANLSAQHVTCLHTSNDFGSGWRTCPIDVNLGNCGNIQAAATRPGMSHQLCPVFYVYAFQYDFKMVPKPAGCNNQRWLPNLADLPPLVMGYRMNTYIPPGEYFALTGPTPPYNVV